jgi:rhomboid protease GluP
MCPNCRALISLDDPVCPECGVQLRRRITTPAGLIGGFIPETVFTTFMILVINGGLWLLSVWISQQKGNGAALMNLDAGTLRALGAKSFFELKLGGQWWRLVTAGFLHGGLMHILMNSWTLFDLGTHCEQVYGTARYLFFYFVSTITGFLVSYWWSPQSVSVGSSAGIFGLIGAMIAVGVLSRSFEAQMIRSTYLRFAGYGLLLSFLPFIDLGAHVGGMVGGFAAAFVAGFPGPNRSARETFWKIVAGLCVVITLYCFWRMYSSYSFSPNLRAVPIPLPRSGV